MKRLIQFVAVFAIGVLVVQPALASLPCAFGAPESCVAGCPMAMTGMGPDCPMTGQAALGECSQDCCSHALSQLPASLAAAEKLRFTALTLSPALLDAIYAPEPGLAAYAPIEARSSSPPRYILNRVVRI